MLLPLVLLFVIHYALFIISMLLELLRFAFGHLPPQEREVRIDAILSQNRRPEKILEGIFQLESADKRVGVLYSQLRTDGTVMLWPPTMLDGYSPKPLFERLEVYCRKNKAKAVMCLADRGQVFDEASLLHDGRFEYLSDLLYLVATLNEDDRRNMPVEDIEFLPLTSVLEGGHERMVAAVRATFYRTKDFPRLIGVMAPEDILHGYKEDGLFDPEIWFFVRWNGEDVGVLILTDQPEDQLELTYMGLVEEVRGRGLARSIIRQARHIAAVRKRTYILTAVDEQNTAALKSYLAEGFQAWDRKKVYAKAAEDF